MERIDLRGLSKTLSRLESGSDNLELLRELYPRKRGIPIIGITGLPGAGKSTLVDQLIQVLRLQGKTVGVIAVDPSSPFSGGALLGDRIRMQRHASDEGVFIRSVGSRGAQGGLSRATKNLALCFDAFGLDTVLIETVGVGQTELDIMGLASTTVVLLVPDAGDAVQTLKAGLMEIADIFVVNKKDRPGANEMKTLLTNMAQWNRPAAGKAFDFHHGAMQPERVIPFRQTTGGQVREPEKKGWEIPVLLTRAETGEGVEGLWETIAAHEKISRADAVHQRHQEAFRLRQFWSLLGESLKERVVARIKGEAKWKDPLEAVAKDTINPYDVLEKMLEELVK